MKFIKIIIRGLILFLLPFGIFRSSVYSESSTRKIVDINIYDLNLNFPFLKNLYDSGFFSAEKYNVNLLSSGEKDIELKGIDLGSDVKSENGEDYAVFNLISENFNQKIKFSWQVHKEHGEDIFYNKPITKLLNLVVEAREKNINDLICEDALKGDIDFKLVYNDEDDGSEVNGYELKIKSKPSAAHRFWRTLGEIIFINSFGVINYWINKHENMEDWEYKPNKEDFKKKITDGWSLDTNAYRTNTIYHIYSGAVFHQTGRSNEYGFAASVAWTFTGSLIWEYIGEFREQVSTNDMIFTTMGGALLGEALRQGSIYLEEVLSPGILRYFFATLLDPMRIINRAIDNWCYDDIDVSMTFINPAQAIMHKSSESHTSGCLVFRCRIKD